MALTGNACDLHSNSRAEAPAHNDNILLWPTEHVNDETERGECHCYDVFLGTRSRAYSIAWVFDEQDVHLKPLTQPIPEGIGEADIIAVGVEINK